MAVFTSRWLEVCWTGTGYGMIVSPTSVLRLFIFVAVLLLQGCAFNSTSEIPIPAECKVVAGAAGKSQNSKCAPTIEESQVIATAGNAADPITMEIIEEVYDGDRLFVEVALVDRAPLPNQVYLLKLRTLNGAEIIDHSRREITTSALSRAPDGRFRSIVVISADAESHNDYQLELTWGTQAALSVLSHRESEKQIAKINNLKLTPQGFPCKEADGSCPITFKIIGEIEYLGSAALKAVELELQYVGDSTQGGTNRFEPDYVWIEGLDLETNESQNFLIHYDREMKLGDFDLGFRPQVTVKEVKLSE